MPVVTGAVGMTVLGEDERRRVGGRPRVGLAVFLAPRLVALLFGILPSPKEPSLTPSRLPLATCCQRHYQMLAAARDMCDD